MKNSFSNIAFLTAALAILLLVLLFPRYERNHTEAPLAWDVSGYYLYLPAVFIYKDLRELKFLPGIIDNYRPSPVADQAFLHSLDTEGRQKMVMKYPMGMALLYLPFFLIAHLIALLSYFPPDGFSYPYQVAVQLGSVAIALLGLWILKKNLRLFFSDKVTASVILFIAIGTNFFNYATFDAAMPHVFLFTLFAFILYLSVAWHKKPGWANSAGIGVCIGLAGLVRPTEVLIALVPLLYGIEDFKSKFRLIIQHFGKLLLAAFFVGFIGFFQLVYWKYASGEWIVYSYQDQTFSFTNPHFADVFFSFRKGWFVYTPLMLFAVAGFLFLWKQDRKLFWPVFLFFIINAWIVSSWDIWWYGGSFGQRAMIQSYALLALPLAAFLSCMSRFRWLTLLTIPVFLFCISLNLFQTYQAHWGPFESDMMTKAYYFRIFGKTVNNPYDRFLIDTNEYFDEDRKNFREVYSTDFEDLPDTLLSSVTYFQSGKKGLWVDSENLLSQQLSIPATSEMEPGLWMHISASYFSDRKEWEIWWMPQTVAVFEKKGKIVKERFFRPFHVLSPNEWRILGLDVLIPSEGFDTLKIFLRNPRNNSSLFMDDLKIGVYNG